MRTRLICFVGTDGSGKSTASDMIFDELSSEGVACSKIWGAYDLRFIKIIVKNVKRLMLKNPSPYGDYSKYATDMKQAIRWPLVSSIYIFMVFCEYWLQIFYKVTVPKLLGKTVVSDRYVYDTVINMSTNLGLDGQAFRKKLEKWLKFFPKPDVLVYVTVPPEVSMSRKNDIPDIEYVRRRHEYYQLLSSIVPIKVVDGTTSINSIRIEMISLAEELLKK